MSLGILELALIVVVSIVAAIAVAGTGGRWIGLVPFVFLFTAILTPADVVSTLAIALPNSLLLALAVRLSTTPVPGDSAT